MKLVRVLCSIGNGLVGLSPPKPYGETCSLHCQGNLFKGQGAPALQVPIDTLLPPCAILCASPHSLDNSHYGSNFCSLGEKTPTKKPAQLDHCDSPGCCICHPPTNPTCSREPGKNLGRSDVKSRSRCPKPALIQLQALMMSEAVGG